MTEHPSTAPDAPQDSPAKAEESSLSSQSITLEQPIHHGEKTFAELEFPPPTAAILKNAGTDSTYATVLGIASDWSGVPRRALEGLGADDGGQVARLVQEAVAPMQGALSDEAALEERIELPLSLKLQHPVKRGASEVVAEVTCTQVVAGHFLTIGGESTMDDFLRLGAKLFQVPPTLVYAMAPVDAAEVLRVAVHFFARFQGT